MTIIRKKTLLLLAAALAIFAASLLFCGSAQAATFTVEPTGIYTDLNVLMSSAITWQDGDEIVLMQDDNSLTRTFVLSKSVTIRSSGGPWTISTLFSGIDPLFQMDGVGLTLTLENVNITGSDSTNANGGSAIDFNGGPHTLAIIGTVNLTGGDSVNDIGGSAVYVHAGTPLTITGNGTGNFTGGIGDTGGWGIAVDSLTVSGSGSFTFTGGTGTTYQGTGGSITNAFVTAGSPIIIFDGLAGLEVGDDVLIGGGSVTATGNQVGAIIGGNLQIGTGAALSATGFDRGITFKGSIISGAGDLTARSTGPGNILVGTGVGMFCNPNDLTLSLTGNVNISGPLGGIGLMDNTLQLTFENGPATGKRWVINGTTEKAFTYYDMMGQIQGLPRGNFHFTGALAGGAYDTDVYNFMLPITPAPSPYGGGWFLPPKAAQAPVPFPAQGIVTGRRINVYKYETLKTVLFRMNKDDVFTILALANNGRALYIEKDGRQGYIAIRDIKATFGAAIKATALKKAGAYSLLESSKLKRIGYYPKEQILWIHGISGKYLINRQTDATYYLDAGQWRLSLSAASGG